MTLMGGFIMGSLKSILDRDLGIEPFDKKNLTPNGYDLSIDEVFIKKTDKHIKYGIQRFHPIHGLQ